MQGGGGIKGTNLLRFQKPHGLSIAFTSVPPGAERFAPEPMTCPVTAVRAPHRETVVVARRIDTDNTVLQYCLICFFAGYCKDRIMKLLLRSRQKTLARIAETISRMRDRLTMARDRYRPEKHYMRGAGPKSKRASTNKQE